MTGAKILEYVKRRLNEMGLTVPTERTDELYDLITEGRDQLRMAFAEAAPVVVAEWVTLEAGVDSVTFNFPAATKDPLKVITVRDSSTKEVLEPSSQLNDDAGHYEWTTLRQLTIGDTVGLTGLPQVRVVLQKADIVAGTAEADIGLPTTCHRAIGKWAAVLALTRNEESDATVATGLLQREIDILEKLYGEYDENNGLALRHALMRTFGEHFGDTLY